MPTPEHQAWREDITKAVNRLRRQFLFTFGLIIVAVILYGLRQYTVTSQIQDLVNQVREDRYTGCLQRAAEIGKYNAAISPPGMVPLFPAPSCPPDPSP